MEKKNLLLVIGSVTLFLIVVLAAGLWLFWPEPKSQASSAAVSVRPVGTQGFDSFEYYKGRQSLPGLEEPKTTPPNGPLTLSIGETGQQPTMSVDKRPPATVQPPAAAAPATLAAPQASQKPVVAARPHPTTPKLTRVNEYWIQVGSYKSRGSADELNKKLSDLGLAATITTRDVSGETYFRVRIGPYKNASEADKFLTSVKAVQGLSASYISKVPRTLTN